MSENKRGKVKITIEYDGDTEVIECNGVAFTTLEDLGDRYSSAVAVVGEMSVKDLTQLKRNVKTDLVGSVDNLLEKYSEPTKDAETILEELFRAVLGRRGED